MAVLDIPAGTAPIDALQVTGGAATPPARTVSVRLSDKIGELELVDLPMLPSLERNSSVSQCYERVSGSDAGDRRERADLNADTSGHRGRAGGHSNCASLYRAPAYKECLIPQAKAPSCPEAEGMIARKKCHHCVLQCALVTRALHAAQT